MATLLDIEDLQTQITLRHGVARAVDGVSLHVDEQEILGIVGESGCGKTMTALSIIQLLPSGGHITSGHVFFDGVDLVRQPESALRRVRGNDIGMVFQDPLTSLNPTVRIGDQIAEAVLLHRKVSRQQARARAAEVLGLVGMPRPEERLDTYAHLLSGGMRQRVMIAMALACEPKLLIADEPTTALDVTIQKQILELIDDLRRRLRMAVILVTHDLGVIAGRADRVAVMYAGRVVETADTRALFDNPRHPYTEALFEALPERSVSNRDALYSIPGMPPDLSAPIVGCPFAPRCRYATEICRQQEPPLHGDTPAHPYACFHPVGDPIDTIGWTAAPAHIGPGPATAGVSITEYDDVRGGGAESDGDATEVRPLLSVQNLVKDFAVTSGAVLQRRTGSVSAVADVSFDVPAGTTMGLVGESGCGKTTIGRLVVGLERPTSGRIVFSGVDIAHVSGRERRVRSQDIQLIFQDPAASMDPRMRVGSILTEPLAIQHLYERKERRSAIRRILDEVGLPSAAVERYPHEFSGGQRQRLALARALLLEPQLVVADEPVSALDVSVQAQVLNMMRDLQDRRGLTYIFISHDLSVVRYVSDSIAVMYLGKLVEIGPGEDIYRHPAHPYTKGLIDAVPTADPTTERSKAKRGVTGELPSAINPPSGCRFRTRCPRAQEICARIEPPLRRFGAPGHLAACHFPLEPPVDDVVPGTTDRPLQVPGAPLQGPSSPPLPTL
ncbi:MAG: dipeptide ABC transporter ATP-binding protein [Actinobacteria bacterium 69-20]|jgi:peptide/nickel transport system ATP-binding protein|nr:ABC transporter ATP-binding protein [Actinomycetota bacterium]OJV23967.1 MAG: dipeptide ABC transporter ATP-binding protein [Actinobacteria bacterium 69-20]